MQFFTDVVIGFRKQNKRRSLGPLFEGAGTAIAVTGGVSCVKDGTPSEPPHGGPPPSKREARPQLSTVNCPLKKHPKRVLFLMHCERATKRIQNPNGFILQNGFNFLFKKRFHFNDMFKTLSNSPTNWDLFNQVKWIVYSKTKGFPRAGFSVTFPLSIISSFPPGIIIALCTLKRPKLSYADNITISL